MASHKEDPVQSIINSPLKDVIVKGFAEVYKVKPDFPVEFLGRWLKDYSRSQARRKQLEENRTRKEEEVIEMQQNKVDKIKKSDEEKHQKEANLNKQEAEFVQIVNKTKFLSDLLVEYLSDAIERFCDERGTPLTGSYVGELKYRHKKLEEHSFEPGTELDTENPKIIEYFGASKSHKFMLGQILANQTGRSYEVFKEEEPPGEQEEGKPLKIKKKYLYVPMVQRDEKMYFFKFPKLGSFACFPLKVKCCLFSQSFDKGIGDYKAFVKNKEEIEKQYNERLNEARGNFEQAKRKFQEHEVNEEDPNSHAEHANLQEEATKLQQIFTEIQTNAPVIESFQYQSKLKEYVFCIDTMGKDSEIPESVLTFVQSKIDFFKQKWEETQYKMLLDDILAYIQNEHSLEAQDNYFRDQQRGIVSSNEGQIKEQFPNRQKEPQFQLTVLKVRKLLKILHEEAYIKSMNTYLNYNIPKYKEIIQIVLMLLGYKKEDINIPRSNTLDGRKCFTKASIEKMLQGLEKYQLRRESSESVQPEYKINKLLERLQKIDAEGVSKYNSWLCALLIIAKSICWGRIQCRDAKIETHEAKTKAMNDREAQIAKYEEDLEKAIEVAKAEVTEETPPYNQEEFLKTYAADNPKPEKLFVQELKSFLDIE